jgi:hypothetical protein
MAAKHPVALVGSHWTNGQCRIDALPNALRFGRNDLQVGTV